MTIKSEVETLHKEGFIYPIPLMEWVSNIVPVAKKQGTNRGEIMNLGVYFFAGGVGV